MATSAEIAQQIADQNSWFMQQSALSSQIGVNPQAYGGMGGWGMRPPQQPVMQPAPGQSMPGGFNFGGGYGYGAGNRMAAMGAAGTSALPWIGGMVGGSSPMFNPAAGFMMARGAGMGMMGAGAAAGVMAAPMAMGAHMLTSMAHGGQQSAMTGMAIGNYNFSNASSMSGQGFSRQDVAGVTRQVRQLAMIPELMTSFEEITRILPQLKQMGTMTGVRDAAEFNRRMKDAIGTIRDVSKIIGTTMEDAAQFFGHSQRVGFFGKQDQLKNALNAQVTQSVTGMNQQQFMQMQEQGAAFGTAIGGSRALGARGRTEIANRLGLTAQNNQGFMETLQNMTGKVGEEAIAEAAGQYQMAGQRVAGTALGRYMIAGFTKFGPNGEASIDSELMARQQRGEISMDQIYAMGQRNMANQNNVVAFTRHQTTLGQGFTEQGGLEGAFTMLRERLGTEKAAVVMQNQYGLSEEAVNSIQASAQEGTTGMGDQKRMVAEITRRNAQRRMNSAGGIWQRLKTRMGNQISQPFEELGSDIHHNVGQFVDEIMEDMAGDIFIQATEQAKKDFAAGLQGDKGALARSFTKGADFKGKTTLTSDLSNAFKSTELYAAFNKTSTTTGRTAEAEFNYLRDMGGRGGKDSADLARRYDEMAGGISGIVDAGWMADKSFMTSMDTNAKNLAARINDEMARDPSLVKASPQEKMDRMKKLSKGMMAGGALSGKTSADVDAVMVMQAQKYLDEGDRLTGAQLANTGFTGQDPTAVANAFRQAKENLGDTFKEAAPLIQKSQAAKDLLSKYYASTPTEQAKILRDLHKGKGTNLSQDEAMLLGRGLVASATEAKGKTAFEEFTGAETGANAMAVKSMLDESSTAAMEAAGGLSAGPLQDAVREYGEAASVLKQTYGTDAAAGAAGMAGAAIDKVAAILEKGGDISKLPPELQAAARRRAGTKRNLTGLTGQNVSVETVMEKTGLSKEAVLRVTGSGGGPIQMDTGTIDALQKASGKSGLATVLGVSAQAQKDQAKEDQQMILFKTMTEALVAIAGNKLPESVRERFRSNQDQVEDGKSGGSGNVTPGMRGYGVLR
jgi:hypothetical protein